MRTALLIALASLCAAAGDALLSRGMKQFGDISALAPAQFWKMLGMFANPWVLIGVALMSGYFFIYSATLSWSDLSYAQPLTALTYLFAALLAQFALGESVGPWRWAGIGLIVAGVAMVVLDGSRAPGP